MRSSFQVLFSSWNFNQTIPEASGSCVLVTGPLGSGKGTVVEAIAHELGKAIMAFDAKALCQPKTLAAAFNNAKLADAFLVINRIDSFEEKDIDKVSELASSIGRFTGVCVLVAEAGIESQHRLHPLLRRILRFNIHLESFTRRQRSRGKSKNACFVAKTPAILALSQCVFRARTHSSLPCGGNWCPRLLPHHPTSTSMHSGSLNLGRLASPPLFCAAQRWPRSAHTASKVPPRNKTQMNAALCRWPQ
jgi:hypothetical protein